jgi:predicted alpha/beta hydrolase family esterase
MTTTTTLIVPGLYSSGPDHWQTWLEEQIPGAVRVIQRDWRRADLPAWSSRIRREIVSRSGRILIVAHSFGALAAAQAADDHGERIDGALLVAPADPAKFAVETLGPQHPLGFPAVVVASTDDPWLSFERAAGLAKVWGAQLVNLGKAGHINAESGYGPWPGALSLLARFGLSQSVTNRNYADGERMIRSALRPRHVEQVPRARAVEFEV